MKLEDSLFEKVYQEIIFLGSFYKGTKVGKPNEFDLNVILKLPLNDKQINVRIFLFNYNNLKFCFLIFNDISIFFPCSFIQKNQLSSKFK